MVYFRVADQGKGIPPGERDHVFERFVRLENDGDGIGLGLSIARTLVALNGGSLRISESASGGALFEITLPRAAA